MYELQRGVLNRSKMFFYSNKQSKNIFFYPLSAGHFYCNANYRIARNKFDSILLTYIISGSLSFMVNGQELTVKENEIAVIDCFKQHTYYTKDSFEAYWLHINGGNTEELFAELTDRFGYIIKSDDETQKGITDIYNILKNNDIISENDLSAKIYALIMSLFNSNRNNCNNNTVSQEAIEYINKYFNNRITVNDIAKHINMSSSHFSRQFKNQIGTSPYDYLLKVRLTKAKELLKNTRLSISEISYQAGFANESNFIYFFKKHEKISPLKFRKIAF